MRPLNPHAQYMTALMEKVLTDAQTRDTITMHAYLLSNESVATPWRDS